MRFFKRFWAVTKFSAKEAFVYRLDFVLSAVFIPLFLLITYFVFKSVYEYSNLEMIRGYTLTALITYYLIEAIVSSVLWVNVDERMADYIRRGRLTGKLLNPISLISRSFLGVFGNKAVVILFQIAPLLLIGIFLLNIKVTWMTLWFIPILALGYVINYFIAFSIGTAAFWITKTKGLRSLRQVIVGFLAGSYIPLTFLPVWFQNASWVLPFQYTKFVPINAFLGVYSIRVILLIIGVQLVWAAVLYGVSSLFWRMGINKYTGVGQ
jgi:ABC-2 type transport system permease protein